MALAKLNVLIGADIGQLKSALTDVQKRISDAGKSMESFGKTMSKRITAPLTALGALSVRAFGQQEQAENRLRAALQANGREVDKLFGKYNSFAQEMQRTTVVGDETTLAMLAQAESLGITGDAAERAVRNSIAMQSAFGVNAQSALRYTAALEEGNASMLTRYLPALRDIEDESERAAAAQDMLTKAFASAEGEAQGVAGSITQMRNAVGDAMEDIGAIISEAIVPFVNRVKELAEQFQELDADVQRNIVVIGALVAAIGPALVIFGKLLTAVSAAIGAVKALNVALLVNPYVIVGTAVVALAGYIAKLTFESRMATRQIERMLDLDPTGTDDEMQKIAASIAEVQGRIEAARKRHEEYGITGTEVAEKELRELEETRLALIRKLQAAKEVQETLTDEEPVKAVETLNEELEKTEQTLKRISAVEPLREIMAEDAVLDLDVNTAPAEGSIAHYEMLVRALNEQIRETTDETWRHALMVQRESIQGQISEMSRLHETQEETGHLMQYLQGVTQTFTDSFGRGMANVIVQGAKLTDVLKNIGRLLLSSAIQSGLRMLLMGATGGAASGGLFGRLLGSVFRVNDAMITSKGDVVKFHPNDSILAMKDFSALGGGGGGTVRIEPFVLPGGDILFSQERAGRNQIRTGRR